GRRVEGTGRAVPTAAGGRVARGIVAAIRAGLGRGYQRAATVVAGALAAAPATRGDRDRDDGHVRLRLADAAADHRVFDLLHRAAADHRAIGAAAGGNGGRAAPGGGRA